MKANTGLEILRKVFGLGDSLRIDSPLTTGQSLIVDQMREWSPTSLSPMVDYVLANNAEDGSPMCLRIMRQENAEGSKAAILTLYDRFPYSEQFHSLSACAAAICTEFVQSSLEPATGAARSLRLGSRGDGAVYSTVR